MKIGVLVAIGVALLLVLLALAYVIWQLRRKVDAEVFRPLSLKSLCLGQQSDQQEEKYDYLDDMLRESHGMHECISVYMQCCTKLHAFRQTCLKIAAKWHVYVCTCQSTANDIIIPAYVKMQCARMLC